MDFVQAKPLLSCVRRAVEKYDMIDEGDAIAVGVSGGKDSLALLALLSELRRFYPKPFTLRAVYVDAGFPGGDGAAASGFCRELGVPFTRVSTEIARIVFDGRGEKNPCALCAKMRRGALLSAAGELGCRKLALGHHADDAVVTFMMNLMQEGRISCFSPVTFLEDRKISVIRPLILARESQVTCFARKNELPVSASHCPADGRTARAETEALLTGLDRRSKGLKHRIYRAIEKGEIDGFKP